MTTDVHHTTTCIAGGGVVGLAVARALALARPRSRSRAGSSSTDTDILLLESASQFGEHSSSRNSEVIHAGIYYPPGSLKADLCIRGKALLYEHCQRHDIPHKRIGKLIVAGTEELPALELLRNNAMASGLDEQELFWLDAAQVNRLEPQVRAAAALLSPGTGIVDSHQLVQSLASQALAAGVTLLCNARVHQAHPISGGFELQITSGTSPRQEQSVLRCREFINCTGLWATAVARSIEGFPEHAIPNQHLVKGNYFSYSGASPFEHLIYPMPETLGSKTLGLGIHATLDLGMQLRFGPDTENVSTIDYTVDETRRSSFEQAIRRYYPDMDINRLQPAYAGIRSRSANGDFVVSNGRDHGLEGLLQFFGIDSPGLTASLALAEVAVREIKGTSE